MKSKKTYIEVIRIIAIFFVLYVHTGTCAVTHYEMPCDRLSGMLAFGMMCLSQTCNALFFMIAGVVLLHKHESVGRVVIRFFKMATVVLLFSLLQYACNYFRMPAMGFRLNEFFEIAYHDYVITQYWFLYEYLAFILLLPFLRILAEKMDKDHMVYLLALYLLMEGMLPLAEYFWKYERFGVVTPFVENIIFYPLLGYLVEYHPEDIYAKKKSLVAINISGCVALMINMAFARRQFLDTGYAETIIGMTMLAALAVFVDIRFACKACKMPRRLEKMVVWCGAGVFGVCLLEPQLRDGFFFLYRWLEPTIKWLPATAIWLGAAMAAGITIMNILKRIPVLKRLF